MATKHLSSRSLFRARSRRRRTRVFLEVLEERCLLATDYWTSATSGSWNNAQDWSTGVPQAGDAVVIDVAGANPTVTFTSGASGPYQSVTVKDTLEVSSGELSTDSAQIDGSLLLDNGGVIDLAASGGSINLAGTTTWTQGDFWGSGNVVNTGTINIPVPPFTRWWSDPGQRGADQPGRHIVRCTDQQRGAQRSTFREAGYSLARLPTRERLPIPRPGPRRSRTKALSATREARST